MGESELLTYDTILLNIYYVAYLLPICIPFYLDDAKNFIDIINKNRYNDLYPRKRCIRCNIRVC